MRKTVTRSSLFVLIALLGIAACSDDHHKNSSPSGNQYQQPILGHKHQRLLVVDGYTFKDMNNSGTLEPYEDWRLPSDVRAKHLISLMTVEEKAGLMMHGTIPLTSDRVNLTKASEAINNNYVNTFITRMSGNPQYISADNNAVQQLAENTRLGIPVLISTDPRNHFTNDPDATSIAAGSFSQWPETLGMAALDNYQLVKEFADIARQEYRAVGIHMALSPQSDLATEPRWGRINGTFGEDAYISKRMTQAYIEGFQKGTTGLNKDSVVIVVKHFAGGGPQLNGLDPHNSFGKEQVYPGNNFAYHLIPFEGAFAANVASVMPYYGIPKALEYKGQQIEEVGFNFNKQILTDILRGEFAFKGMVLSDWLVITDCEGKCITGLTDDDLANGVSPWSVGMGMPWGVESLTMKERIIKAVNAGIDQFGGVSDATELIAAINEGSISMQRIDQAVERILAQKFALGLFENPYVDESNAIDIVGNEAFQAKAREAQGRAHVLLKNDNMLPVDFTDKKVYLHQVNKTVASNYGIQVVDNMADADLIILRVNTPYQTDPRYAFGSVHFGQLGFADDDNSNGEQVVLDTKEGKYTGSEDYKIIKQAEATGKPVIISVYLDRPAILTNIMDRASVILGEFGSMDSVLLDVLQCKIIPEGKLPFQLPADWDSVLSQRADVPSDAANELFPLSFSALNQ